MCWATSRVSDRWSRRRASTLDVQRVVDLRHRVGGELDVDDGADDARDAPGAAVRRGVSTVLSVVMVISLTPVLTASASAPPTISLISWVISAWRAALAAG